MKTSVFFYLFLSTVILTYSQDTINITDASGKKQGFWRKMDKEGKKIYEGHFRDDRPVGEFKYFYPEGNLKAISIILEDGNRTRTTTYFKNGRKMAEGEYVNEKKEGLWRFFSEYDGVLVSEENYLNGKKDGISKTFYGGDGIAEILWKKRKN